MRTYLLLPLLLVLSGFSSQPEEERKLQAQLPQSQDAAWNDFIACKVKADSKNFTYSITYTPAIRALEGKTVSISGFMLPLEATEKFKHFLLSKRTPTCGFCPPGEPNEVFEVFAKKPVTWDEKLVVTTGTLKLTNQAEKGIFFQLKDAEVKPGGK